MVMAGALVFLASVLGRASIVDDYELNPHGLPEPIHQAELGRHPCQRMDRRSLRSKNGTELVPVYPGYGTHYAFLYVGTPPQRQSVIIDTGSHITAFPCTGCKQCGTHTDPYFMPSNSSTASALKCGPRRCEIAQSYSEGSSWKAYKVRDTVYLAGGRKDDNRHATDFKINMTFGCQVSQTGLFRTQLEEGIMGLSNQPETIPHQLVAQGKAKTRIFALCYRAEGGILTLGGVDRRIHHNMDTIHFAKYKASGSWYGVIVKKVQFERRGGDKDGELVDIGSNFASFQTAKGSIVDSGTTDTYLPRSLAGTFMSKFKDITGHPYSNKEQLMDSKLVDKIPNIIFTLQGVESDVRITMLWSAYTEVLKNGRRAFRVYLTESSGAVLGANFMNGFVCFLCCLFSVYSGIS